MLKPALYVPLTPASWHYQLELPVTFLHAPFLSLLHWSGTLHLHTFFLSTNLSTFKRNHTSSSQLSLQSLCASASDSFFTILVLYKFSCMYICMYFCCLFADHSFSILWRFHVFHVRCYCVFTLM